MGKLCVTWARVALLWALVGVRTVQAEGGERIVLVADSRRFSGWEAWWTNLFNESYLYFALLTIVIIPLLGLTMGKLTDLVIARIGINLKSRVLAEH
jgi:hypothetical protein